MCKMHINTTRNLCFLYCLAIVYSLDLSRTVIKGNNKISLSEYVNFVKYLLQSAEDFSVHPEPLQCTDIDPDKQLLWYFPKQDEGIRICDLCPKFSPSKLTGITIDAIPYRSFVIQPSIGHHGIAECLDKCYKINQCIALSLDRMKGICNIFNSTNGDFKAESHWTTIVIKQPVEYIGPWVYSRHTRITQINATTSSILPSFLECLHACDSYVVLKAKCDAISYDFNRKSCSLYSNFDNYELSYEYGIVTAMRQEIDTWNRQSSSWRFLQFESDRKFSVTRHSGSCPKPLSTKYGNFYTQSCLATNGLGCDSNKLGCQSCYYPEISNSIEENLPICKNSRYMISNRQDKMEQNCFDQCSQSFDCLAVDLSSDEGCSLLSPLLWEPPSNKKERYDLIYPNSSHSLSLFSWTFQSKLTPIRGLQGNGFIRRYTKTSLNKCLQYCISDPICQKINFVPANGECSLASIRVGFTTDMTPFDQRSRNSIVFFRKTAFHSPLFSFHRTPGYALTSAQLIEKLVLPCVGLKCAFNTVERCCKHCLIDLKHAACQFVSVQYFSHKLKKDIVCYFYKESRNNSYEISKYQNSEIFIRSLMEINLENLNAMPFFQTDDVGRCFERDSEQTQTTLINDTNLFLDERWNSTLGFVSHRRVRRGFFDFLKSIGEAIVDTVKDTFNTVVDTAEGVIKSMDKVVKGDFKGAVKEFVNIPIVKSAGEVAINTIKLGQSLVKGEFNEVGDLALEIATSKIFDVIPYGKAVKFAAKPLKKTLLRNSRGSMKEKPLKGKKQKGGQNHGKCRPRRTPSRKRPRDCDEDEEKKCPNPKINNAISRSLIRCNFMSVGRDCDFECKPGYYEYPQSDISCSRGNGTNKNKAVLNPNPQCKESQCPSVREGRLIIPFFVYIAKIKVTLYVVKFDRRRRLPIWSIACHDNYNSMKHYSRVKEFYKYPCLNLRQPRNVDFRNSGWDTGHLTPANLMRFSLKAVHAINSYVNVAPQHPFTNQFPWRTLEAHVECFMNRETGLVVTGICADEIGTTRTGLQIPSCFWKMICYRKENKTYVVGFIGNNSHVSGEKQKQDRIDQIGTPVSQEEIIKAVNISESNNPWLESAMNIFSGRKILLNPDFPRECAKQVTLDEKEASWWNDTIRSKNKLRSKRQITETRGCTSEEMNSMASMLDLSTLSMSEVMKNNQNILPEDNSIDGIITVEAASCDKRIIGYYTSWGKDFISPQQASRLTHIVYAFLEIKSDGRIVVGSPDPTHSQNVEKDAELSLKRLEQLHNVAIHFPHLKVMFAVGGWENSQYFSSIAKDPKKRLTFIASVIQLIKRFGFDGIDIDWEYPVTGGAQEGEPGDKNNYVLLMKEIRQVLDQLKDEERRVDPYLISFAGAAGEWTLDPGFDLTGLLTYADWVNIMTYDYFGAWGSKWGAYTGPPAPLYFAMPSKFSGKTNVHFTVKYYVCRVKNPHKINMGVPLYGRYWENVGEVIDSKFPMWRKANAVNGKFVGGSVAWKEIQSKYLSNSAFQKHFDDKAKAPYAWNPTQKIYLGYEDRKSLNVKVQYAVENNLGGIMVWAIDQDDADYSMLDILASANLCKITDPNTISYKCSPLTDRRWWIWDEDKTKAGMCGKSAPLYKGYYPVCDPDDPGYSCCGSAGYCGNGPEYCSCPTCKDYASNPNKLVEEPIKPTQPIQWYTNEAPDGKRGRCGRDVPKIKGQFAICNPDDENKHCCSNAGYCGSSLEFCTCDGCIDFKLKPDYRFPEKKWWTWADGADKSGKCGPNAPKLNSKTPICDPDSTASYCCSSGGFCGNSPAHCTCNGCVNFKKNPKYVYP